MDSKPSPGDLRAPTGGERMIPSLLSEGIIRFLISAIHPHPFGVEACSRREAQLKNSSLPNDLVVDPFLGSGTTLISAHALGRACFGLEIDPRYAQVSIERWQRHTGQKAQRIEAGDATEVSDERTGRSAA